jgi:hypothetical protein
MLASKIGNVHNEIIIARSEESMDPVTLIVTALATGGGAGLSDAASSAVGDAYQALRSLASNRLAGRREGALALARHAEAPSTWETPLAAELSAAGAAGDACLIAAAQALMDLVDPRGTRTAKYVVDTSGAQGVQVGDGGTQHNTFHSAPAGEAT